MAHTDLTLKILNYVKYHFLITQLLSTSDP